MKIVFTGGGTGGHFYPIIAVAQSLSEKVHNNRILPPKLYFMSPNQYNPRALFDNDIEFVKIPAGKIRRYFSLLNFSDIFKTIYGVIIAIWKMYLIYPDVVFSKGGYSSFPALFAARILRIPVIIHESDSSPGKVSRWSAKFAEKIAVSYPGVADFFPKQKELGKIAFTGNPIRREIIQPLSNGAREYLHLEDTTPVILIIGGSQGSTMINEAVLNGLVDLVDKYQIIHQTGKNNFASTLETSKIILQDSKYAYRYHPLDYLDDLSIRMAAGVSSIIISRAGSTIFEIAAWGIPSIILPLSKVVSHDQVKNAFAYAQSGACTVIEEFNLTSHILISEINRIMDNPTLMEKMRTGAKQWAHTDAADKIAEVILETSLKHE